MDKSSESDLFTSTSCLSRWSTGIACWGSGPTKVMKKFLKALRIDLASYFAKGGSFFTHPVPIYGNSTKTNCGKRNSLKSSKQDVHQTITNRVLVIDFILL